MSTWWSECRNELAVWSLDTARRKAQQAGVAVEAIDRFVSRPQKPQTRTELQEALERVWQDPTAWPRRAELQAYYLYMRCLKSWEISLDHRSIEALIEVVQKAWRPGHQLSRLSVDVLVRHTATVTVCMAVEKSLLCSCPSDLAEQARKVVSQSRVQLVRLRQLACPTPFSHPTRFGALVTYVLQVDICYFDCLAAMADSVIRAQSKGPTAAAELTRTIARLSHAEHSRLLRDSVYASQLRAHRRLLTILRDRLTNPRSPILQIREARVTYVYPFTLDGFELPKTDPNGTAATEGNNAGHHALELWGEDNGTRPNLAGETPRSAVEMGLELTDIWSPPALDSDSSHGTVVKMPGLSVTTTAPDPERPGHFIELPELDVEIWLGRFGNHHVRVQTPVMTLSLHELNQALRRGSTWMGPEAIRGGSARKWSRVADYVDDVVESLAVRLNDVSGANGEPPTRSQVRAHIDVDADYHAVVEIRAASVRVCGGERPATIDDLRNLAGSLLFQPIERVPITLEEWICTRTPQEVPNLLGESRFDCDFAGRSANTTVLFLPAAPNWGYLSFMEMAEYIATLPALLRMWRRQLDLMHRHALVQLAKWREPERRRHESEIDETRLNLSEFIAHVRAQRTPLSSVDLVRSDAHRMFLDNLMHTADIPRLMAELDRKIKQTDHLYAYMVEYERTLEDERRRRYENAIQSVLAFVALLSLAGLFSYVHSLIIGGDSNIEIMSGEQFELAVFFVVFLPLSVVLVIFYRRRR